ncbi:MAG TPA: DUF6125 family protein [Phycisphaerae bacterium]|nr:DUF6125 family protein [Phycisphaerae bacterium]HOJ73020.1 DUF6125 family protein [Phycisphaerae bacterium]HOM50204.1 DUF6125 family protein [Phycisphaerae bacterium]HON65036.1 DUF6125 family protein [Phycisphaerae bacterium]HPP26493.1 DUF6125 family protein [Phycisphaerae bacterium]
MIPLSDRQIAAYFQRSFTAVDGLWFMKLEERADFETALQVDEAVWRIMPKIQARKLKELTGLTAGMDALRECFTTKLSIEDYAFDLASNADGFEISIADCPWVNLLVRSNRQHLADTIGRTICTAEHAVWASEFGDTIRFEFGERLCAGCPRCVLRFRETRPT